MASLARGSRLAARDRHLQNGAGIDDVELIGGRLKKRLGVPDTK